VIIVGNFKYITNRTIFNDQGKETGRIAVLVRNGSDDADVKYTCPECEFSEQTKRPWKRPFSLKCSKCGFLIRLPRLKDEMKRKKKTPG
jgi:ssDNA-binding Zn-finger/Zn-ribbon topoisomerase 1